MKFFAFLMAFLVLALSVMPCADSEAGVGQAKIVTKITKADQQKESPFQDSCSPFCQCACCAGFPISHYPASLSGIQPHSIKDENAYLPISLFDIALPIWQPPQLV